MALFIKQNEPRSQLQQKIAADLDKRLKARDARKIDTPPLQPAILDDSAPASGTAWLVWLIAGIAIVAGAVWVLVK